MYVKATTFASEIKTYSAVDTFRKYLEKYCRPYPIDGKWQPGFINVEEMVDENNHYINYLVTYPNKKIISVQVWRTDSYWYATSVEATNSAQSLDQEVITYKVDTKIKTKYVSNSMGEVLACGYNTRTELIEKLNLREQSGRYYNSAGEEYFITEIQTKE